MHPLICSYSILGLFPRLQLPAELQLHLFLAVLSTWDVVFGPGGTTVVLGIDVVHLVLFAESLSDAEDIVVLCISLNID
jgi:small basic protein